MPIINLDSIIMKTDSYKVSHWVQYPKGAEVVRAYFESRGGEFPETVFFGLQYFVDKYLTKPITMADVDAAERFWTKHGMAFNYKGWESIVVDLGGKLPISIRAVPEGSVVPTGNVLMTVENTDPRFYWLPNYLETLLVKVWYPCTVATISREAKKIWMKYLTETGDPAGIDFKHHDFGYRGVSSEEQAAIGGAAHLVNFQGTDTIAGAIMLAEYYEAGMAGFSIPASEHSTITSWGLENEYQAFSNMLDQYPTGLVACVSDSRDIYDACRAWGSEPLKSRVLGRDGTLVIRPDSGHPPEVVVKCLDILTERFGFTINSKGYKVLPPQVRLIQGDGIDLDMLRKILSAMKNRGYSADNLATGSGGGLLQKMNRDTSRYAFKCSEIVIDGNARPVFKSPVTDPSKKSKHGNLDLVRDAAGQYTTVACDPSNNSVMREIFRDGKVLVRYNLDTIRANAALKATK